MTDLFTLLQTSFPNVIQHSDMDTCVAQIVATNTHSDADNSTSNSTDGSDNNDDEISTLSMGGLFVLLQTDERNNTQKIWLRHMQAHSMYPIADTEELLAIIDGVLHDEVLWVMEYKDDAWISTVLVDAEDDIDAETKAPNSTYRIYSWSGKQDRIINEK